MGCSSSRDARGHIEMPVVPAPAPAERRQSLRSSQSPAGLPRPLPQPARRRARLLGVAARGDYEGRRQRWSTPGGKRGLVAVLENAASATSSTAQWPASPSGCRGESSSPPPVQHVPDFDPGIMSGFRQTFVEPSRSHPALLFPEKEATTPRPTVEEPFDDDMGTPVARDIPEVTGFVRARVDEFHEKLEEKKKMKEQADEAADVTDEVAPPPRPSWRAGKAVVVYFTSLRGVRRTFEDGRAVRAILRCYRVRVDERDVSMHAAFKAELRDLLGGPGPGEPVPLVFVGDGAGKLHDLGGADNVRALDWCELLAGGGAHLAQCAACGDMRFLPCETCYGSCRIFARDEDGRQLAGMFRRCPDCNENGLIRCPVCCPVFVA